MVKRSLVILLLMVLLALPSWAVESSIIDEGAFLSAEESQGLQAISEALQEAFSIQTKTFLLIPDEELEEEDFKALLKESFPFTSERSLYFALDGTRGIAYVGSEGIQELDPDTLQKMLDEALAVDFQGKLILPLTRFYSGIFDILQANPQLAATSESEEAVADEQEVLAPAKVYLDDGANLWNQEQKDMLFKEATRLSNREDMAILLVTTDYNPDKSSEAFIEDLAEEKFGIDTDQVAFLIDMDNRKIEVNTSGRAIDIIHDDRLEAILDGVYLGMEKEDYFLAGQNFIKETDLYLAQGIDPNYGGRKERGENNLSPLDAILGLGLGGVGGFLNFARVKKSYAKKTAPIDFQYRNNIIGGIPLQAGRPINKRVTQRKIPKSGGGDGGSSSTTHKSSSGGTRGGGGKSF
ncbi:MAG TPA: TPM domain-containing protein [Clostridia bacterium]|nr:TPM domain-containing protein [Clostridia bacterium]